MLRHAGRMSAELPGSGLRPSLALGGEAVGQIRIPADAGGRALGRTSVTAGPESRPGVEEESVVSTGSAGDGRSARHRAAEAGSRGAACQARAQGEIRPSSAAPGSGPGGTPCARLTPRPSAFPSASDGLVTEPGDRRSGPASPASNYRALWHPSCFSPTIRTSSRRPGGCAPAAGPAPPAWRVRFSAASPGASGAASCC